MSKIYVGIDPTSGSRSSLGISVVDVESMTIISAKEFQIPKTTELRPRLKHIALCVAKEFKLIEDMGFDDYTIAIETTVMAGLGGQSLQRAIGAIAAISPSKRKWIEVYPMTVKKYITGVGKGGDKKDIAEGLKKFFPNSDLLFQLTASSRYDTLDSIAIALTGAEANEKVQLSKRLSDSKPGKTKQKKRAKSTSNDMD